jgi:class 3 adenylate cyclase
MCNGLGRPWPGDAPVGVRLRPVADEPACLAVRCGLMVEGTGGGVLPAGTVSFLLTDIEGSTRLWEEHPDEMRAAVARHDQIVAAAVEGNAGTLVKARGEGDSAFAVFARATDAVAAALELQRTLTAEPWPEGVDVRVRAAVHTGEAELRDDDYYGGGQPVRPFAGHRPWRPDADERGDGQHHAWPSSRQL